MRFRPNYDLSKFNTFRLRSTAKYYTRLTSISQLYSLSEFIKEHTCKWFILGGGSNILLPEYYDGFVIHNQIDGYRVLTQNDNEIFINVNAGVIWDKFVEECTNYGWYGLENLSKIPGTVGAAPVQNIGAYGVEVGEFIDCIYVYDFDTQKTLILSHAECEFSYRNSMLKNNSRYMVLSVVFKLQLKPRLNLTYPELAKHIGESRPTARLLRVCVSDLRRNKLPDPNIIHNVGSFFHNPIVALQKAEELSKNFPKLPIYKVDDNYCKLSAGWLIDSLGLKGYRTGDIMVYEKHALILVNKGKVTQEEVLSFASVIQNKVFVEYGVQLNIEPIIIE